MIYQTFVSLTLLLIFLTITFVKSCPCALVGADTPAIITTDLSSANQLFENESNDNDFDQLVPISKYEAVYPLVHHTKSLSTSRKRFKRPSWATVGKRSSIVLKKRPSWAQVG